MQTERFLPRLLTVVTLLAALAPLRAMPNPDDLLDQLQRIYYSPAGDGIKDYAVDLQIDLAALMRPTQMLRYYWSSTGRYRVDFPPLPKKTREPPLFLRTWLEEQPLDLDLGELRRDFHFTLYQAAGAWELRGSPAPHGRMPHIDTVIITLNSAGIYRIWWHAKNWHALLTDPQWDKRSDRLVLRQYYFSFWRQDEESTWRVIVDRQEMQGAMLPEEFHFTAITGDAYALNVSCDNYQLNPGLSERFLSSGVP